MTSVILINNQTHSTQHSQNWLHKCILSKDIISQVPQLYKYLCYRRIFKPPTMASLFCIIWSMFKIACEMVGLSWLVHTRVYMLKAYMLSLFRNGNSSLKSFLLLLFSISMQSWSVEQVKLMNFQFFLIPFILY